MPRKKRKVTHESPTPQAEDQAEDATKHIEDTKTIPAEDFTIPFKDDKTISCKRQGSGSKLMFTHGAGGGLESPAMTDFAAGFAEHSQIVSFKGNMNMKSRLQAFSTVITHESAEDESVAALGGRSMGARAAAMTASEEDCAVKALVLVSFPLTSAKGDSREQTLLDIPKDVDVLFVEGDRDSMCDLEDLRRLMEQMEARCWLLEVSGADHSTNFKKSNGDIGAAMRKATGSLAAQWVASRDDEKRWRRISWDVEEDHLIDGGWKATAESPAPD